MLLMEFLKSYSSLRAKLSVNLETTTEQPRTKKPREAFGLRALERRFFPAEDHPHFRGFRPSESADKSDALL